MGQLKGSITIMLILMMGALVSLTALVVEVARIKIAQEQVQRATDMAAQSSLANYDTFLKENYGIFMGRTEPEALRSDIETLIKETLRVEDPDPAWNPYQFKIETLRADRLFGLQDTPAVRHQILETMKYRGPQILAGEVALKMQGFLTVSAAAETLKESLKEDALYKKYGEQKKQLLMALSVCNEFTPQLLDQADQVGRIAIGNCLRSKEDPVTEGDSPSGLYENQILCDPWLENIRSTLEATEQAEALTKSLIQLKAQLQQTSKATEKPGTNQNSLAAGMDRKNQERLETLKQSLEDGIGSQLLSDLNHHRQVLERRQEGFRQARDGMADSSDLRLFSGGQLLPLSLSAKSLTEGSGPETTISPGDIFQWFEGIRQRIQALKEAVVPQDASKKVLSCPEVPSSGVSPAATDGFSGDSYDQINGTLTDLLEPTKSPVSESERSIFQDGKVQASQALYESLLINEYVLYHLNRRDQTPWQDHYLQDTEAEFVLIGSPSPQINGTLVQMEILGWRTVFNWVSIQCYCPEIQQKIKGLAVSLNAMTEIPYPVWQNILTGGFALLESALDYGDLKAGGEVPLVKMSPDQFKALSLGSGWFQPSTSASDTDSIQKSQPNQTGEGLSMTKEAPTSKTGKWESVTVNYEDHLRGMLLIRSLSGQETQMVQRIQHLIYTTMKNEDAAYSPSDHFNGVRVHGTFQMRSFFPNLKGIRFSTKGIPNTHTISVDCSRYY